MEFPDLGKHCSEKSCNRLDFLPLKCDACNKVFCSSHFNNHQACPGALKNVQVPVCPLCGVPVPTAPGVLPDITVSQHLDKQCKSDTTKIFTNRCSYASCKRKELIPVTCSICKQNFCLRHRHSADHDCRTSNNISGSISNRFIQSNVDQRTLTANAAEYRRSHKPTTLFNSTLKPNITVAQTAGTRNAQMQNLQGNMSDDEALQRAIALSILELDEAADRNRRNEAAAQHNAAVPVGGRDGQQTNEKDKCLIA